MQVMADMGMIPAEPALVHSSPPSHLAVQLDGRVIGHIAAKLAPLIVQRLHSIKAGTLALQEGNASQGRLPSLQVCYRFPCHRNTGYVSCGGVGWGVGGEGVGVEGACWQSSTSQPSKETYLDIPTC